MNRLMWYLMLNDFESNPECIWIEAYCSVGRELRYNPFDSMLLCANIVFVTHSVIIPP